MHTEFLNGKTVAKTYAWGTDLSGSFQGAGGVGGLLAIQDRILGVNSATMYDGNGNLTGLVKKGTAEQVAEYEYTAFGETLTAKGSYARKNTYSFSTKPLEEGTEYYYYGYRFYNPKDGRWLNRDPIEERGGMNLYGMVENDSINRKDYLGLQSDTTIYDKWDTANLIGQSQITSVLYLVVTADTSDCNTSCSNLSCDCCGKVKIEYEYKVFAKLESTRQALNGWYLEQPIKITVNGKILPPPPSNNPNDSSSWSTSIKIDAGEVDCKGGILNETHDVKAFQPSGNLTIHQIEISAKISNCGSVDSISGEITGNGSIIKRP